MMWVCVMFGSYLGNVVSHTICDHDLYLAHIITLLEESRRRRQNENTHDRILLPQLDRQTFHFERY